MRSRYKFDNDKGLYFITSSIVEFIPIFTSNVYCKIILDSLQFSRVQKNLKIIAYVIMDNHFHAIIESDNLQNKIKAIKGYTAIEILKQLNIDNKNWLLNQLEFYKKKHKNKSKYQVWQEGAHPQLIQNQEMAIQKIDYIHYNPIKRGLVEKPEHWVFSSASNYINNSGVIEIDKFDEF